MTDTGLRHSLALTLGVECGSQTLILKQKWWNRSTLAPIVSGLKTVLTVGTGLHFAVCPLEIGALLNLNQLHQIRCKISCQPTMHHQSKPHPSNQASLFAVPRDIITHQTVLDIDYRVKGDVVLVTRNYMYSLVRMSENWNRCMCMRTHDHYLHTCSIDG